MLIQATKIIGLPVAAIDTQSKIGEVKKIVIDPENGSVLGMVVAPTGFFAKQKILSSQDIIDFDKNGIVTKSDENLLDTHEVIRIEKILANNIKIIGQKAITSSKNRLGTINDILIDLDTLAIVKYYISGLFQERILTSDKLVKITKDALIFSDDTIEQIPSGEIEGAAA